MQPINVLDERIIDSDVEVANREEVLILFAGKLRDAGYIADVEVSKRDIYLRESEGIAGIGNYIATPCGKSDSVTQVDITITKLKHEIEWEALDDKGVRLVFLSAASNDHEHTCNHILLLADIARKLGNDEAVERLLQVENIGESKEISAGK